MLSTLNEAMKRVQDMVEDPAGSWCTENYLLQTVNQRWDDLNQKMKVLGLKYEEAVVTINPFPANTSNFATYQAAGGVLAALQLPKRIEWKLVGEADTSYREADHVDVVGDVDTNQQGILSWEFRAGIVYVTPSSVAIVVRVRFEQMTTQLYDPTSGLWLGTTNVLAYMVAEMVANKRGNAQLAQYFAAKAADAQDDFEQLCMMSNQGIVRRFGRMSRRSRFRNRVEVHL